jgi:hypothetical protein
MILKAALRRCAKTVKITTEMDSSMLTIPVARPRRMSRKKTELLSVKMDKIMTLTAGATLQREMEAIAGVLHLKIITRTIRFRSESVMTMKTTISTDS